MSPAHDSRISPLSPFLFRAEAAAAGATETENVYGECPSSLERPIQREKKREGGGEGLAYARRPTTTGVPPAEINRGLIIIILFSPGLKESPSSRRRISRGEGGGEGGCRFFNSWERN